MYTNKNSNHFAMHLPDFPEYEESLDTFIGDMLKANKSFDTWYQAVFRMLAACVPTITFNSKQINIYDYDDECSAVFMGLERRRVPRTKINTLRALFMPKTLKIKHIDNDEAA